MFEVRGLYKNPEKLKQLLNENDAVQIKEFNFSDDYFAPSPITENWRNGLTSIRVRKFQNETKLLFSKFEIFKKNDISFIKNKYIQKVVLIRNDKQQINDFIKSLNLIKIATLRRKSGKVYKINFSAINNLEFTVEDIENYGLSGEIEIMRDIFNDVAKMKSIKEFLTTFMETILTKPLIGDYLQNLKHL